MAEPLFGNANADRLFRLADAVDRDHHPRRHSGRDLRALRIGAKDNSTVTSLWIWLAGTAILTIPAIGNFLSIGL